ncbi:hypothetical protein ABTE40_20555, partial [Acinetobacter baumannii]
MRRRAGPGAPLATGGSLAGANGLWRGVICSTLCADRLDPSARPTLGENIMWPYPRILAHRG